MWRFIFLCNPLRAASKIKYKSPLSNVNKGFQIPSAAIEALKLYVRMSKRGVIPEQTPQTSASSPAKTCKPTQHVNRGDQAAVEPTHACGRLRSLPLSHRRCQHCPSCCLLACHWSLLEIIMSPIQLFMAQLGGTRCCLCVTEREL